MTIYQVVLRGKTQNELHNLPEGSILDMTSGHQSTGQPINPAVVMDERLATSEFSLT